MPSESSDAPAQARARMRPRIRLSLPSHRRRVFVAIFGLALSFVPMVGSLGYFGALLWSPLFAWLGIAIGVDHGRSEDSQPAASLAAATRELGGLWLLLVGLLGSSALWNPNCDLLGGLAFFALGPLISGALGVVCGRIAADFSAGRGRALLLGGLPFLACLSLGLWRLYFDPVVFAFDPFWGHFAGPIYDEAVAIGTRDLHFRAYNLATALAAIGGWLLWRGRAGSPWAAYLWTRRGLVAAIALAALVAGSYGLRPTRFGFHQTRASLEEILRGRRETAHFVIHYAPRTLTALEIDDVAAEHEHAWQRLEALIGAAPEAKVHAFVFDNEDQKRALFGAGNVEVSMPYRGHIYLTRRPFPHDVLHHELAHTFAGEFGDRLLGLSRRGVFLNVGLIEGVANALAPRPRDALDLHDQAAVLEALGKRPPLDTIMGLGFWGQSASRAYTAAGSFCLWLLETRGAASLMEAYQRAGDFEAVYGEPLAALEAQWLADLRSRPLDAETIESQRLRFQRRSVFRRPCAHRAAQLQRAAARARHVGDDDEATAKLRELCSIEAKEPRHRMALAAALAAGEDFDGAGTELEAAREMPDLTDADQARIAELRGDIALVAGRWSPAASAYEEALTHALREARRRAVQIKLLAARSGLGGDERSARLLRRYFSPFDVITPDWVARLRSASAAVELSRRPGFGRIGHYLAARQFTNATLIEDALAHIEAAAADPTEPPSSPELSRAELFLRVELRMRQGDYAGARAALDDLEAIAEGGGHRLRISQWRARIVAFEALRPIAP